MRFSTTDFIIAFACGLMVMQGIDYARLHPSGSTLHYVGWGVSILGVCTFGALGAQKK